MERCEEPDHLCFTCSPSCAGKLAYSRKEANLLRKQFNNKTKNDIRSYLIKHYIEPSPKCVKPTPLCFRILDFWGGGLFVDAVIDQEGGVNNHKSAELTTIDNNKSLYPALRAYAIKKNQQGTVKNQSVCVIPFCGSLAEYVHYQKVKNQRFFDFIWLDYCGSVTGIDSDIELLGKIANEKTTIVITVFRGRDSAINEKGRNLILDTYINQSFPLHKRVKDLIYKTDSGNMGTYIYKVPGSIFKKLSYLPK